MPASIKHPHGHEYPAPPPNPPPPAGAVTLFDRLGRRPGISRLIKWFYAQVRFEPDLQPIFDAHISHWGPHLELLIDFWSSRVEGGPDLYSGNLGRHARLSLGPEHYATWLRVWEKNARHLLQPREAEQMIEIARGLTRSMPTADGAADKSDSSNPSAH